MLHPRSFPVLVVALLLATSCEGIGGPLDGQGLTGDWCTLRSLDSSGRPVQEAAWVGGQWSQDGDQVLGTGSVKRAGDDEIWPSRFRGDILGENLVLHVTPLGQDQEGAPVLELDLRIEGRNDLVGTVTGDSGIQGEIALVRLGARCFAD